MTARNLGCATSPEYRYRPVTGLRPPLPSAAGRSAADAPGPPRHHVALRGVRQYRHRASRLRFGIPAGCGRHQPDSGGWREADQVWHASGDLGGHVTGVSVVHLIDGRRAAHSPWCSRYFSSRQTSSGPRNTWKCVSAGIKRRQFGRFRCCQKRRRGPAGTRGRQPPESPAAVVPRFFPAESVRPWTVLPRRQSRNCGTTAVLGVWFDGLDHQVEFVGTVDPPRNAIVLARCGRLGFGEVMQPINAAGRVISHEQNGTGAEFRPREQEQVIGAEVEHRGENLRAGAAAPAPIGSAVEGLPGGLLHPGYRHRAAHDRAGNVTQPAVLRGS